jgi:hypothetical protein
MIIKNNEHRANEKINPHRKKIEMNRFSAKEKNDRNITKNIST